MDVEAAVVRYAGRFHGVGPQPAVASPLGAWLVLALAAPAARGALREEVEDALGCSASDASSAAGGLLADPHPLVAAAAAAWWLPESATPDLDEWVRELPASVARGDVPSRPAADAWARDHTFGLVDRFPLRLGPEVLLVLASALATKVSWETPYTVVPGAELGADSPFGRRVRTALRMPDRFRGDQFVASTARAGDVAVHWASARDGLRVVSVAAAPEVAPTDVLAAAHALAVALPVGQGPPRRSLFDLPLGDGPAWTLREDPAGYGRPEQVTAVLPAWSAWSERNLMDDPGLGFQAAATGLAALLGGGPTEARQAAVARYSRIGFEAGAVTGIMVMTSMQRSERVRRVAELRFAHPYAVVAVAAGGTWDRLPVFSAWVTEPSEAE